MTNALVQNTDKQSSAIDLLLQSNNTLNASRNYKNEDSKFSNIINNLEAKTNKMQSDIEKSAQKTNTSSINKKIFDNKQDDAKRNIGKDKEALSVQKENVQKRDKKNTQTFEKNIISKEKSSVETAKINNQKQNTTADEKIENQPIKIKKEDISKDTDINNSSPVESSPVFLDEKTDIEPDEIQSETLDTDININDILNQIQLIVQNNPDIKNSEIKAELEEFFQSEKINSSIENFVEEISSSLNNTDLSNREKQEVLTNTLDELKDVFSDILNNSETVKFDDIATELKNQIATLKEDSINKIQNNIEDIVEKNEKTDIEVDFTADIKEVTEQVNEKLENLADKIADVIKNDDIESLEQLEDEINSILDEVQNNIEISFDDKKTKNITQDDKRELNNILDTIENLYLQLKNIKTASDTVEKADSNINDDVIEVDFLKNINQMTDNSKTNETVSSKTTKTGDKTKEIVELLDNLQNESELEENTLETDKKISSSELKDTEDNKIQYQTDDYIIDDVSGETDTKESQNNNQNSKNNTIDAIDGFENVGRNNNGNLRNQNENNFKQQGDFQDNIQEDVLIEDTNNIDIENNVQTDIKTSETKTKNKVDIDEIEANLEKIAKIKNIMQDMMLEAKSSTISYQSGALSVADEVAKLAMNETTSLNPVTSVHGAITYDSLNSETSVIKNAAGLMKNFNTANSEETMSDVLNQLTNKISQMKDSSAQKLTMVLRPNDLGRLSIELTNTHLGLSTHILAQNDDVRSYIEKNINNLRQQLSDAGINVNSIQIKTMGQEGSSNYDGNQSFLKDQNDTQHEQNNKNNQQNFNQNRDKKETEQMLSSISNYDMHFAKDFSSIINKSMSYILN